MWFAADRFGSVTDLRTAERWPPARLAAEAHRRVGALRRRGVVRGDRVLILAGAGPAFFADLFAVWEVGACAICASPKLTVNELDNVSAFMDARLIVGPRLEELPRTAIASASLAEEADVSGGDTAIPSGSLDDEALILLTSGTTGMPKGVVHTFRSLLARVALNRGVIGDRALTRTLCVLPLHFGHGLIGNALTPLMSGHDLLTATDMPPTFFGDLDRVIDEHRITFMSSVPTTWRMVQRFGRRRPRPTLLRVHVGSAPLSATLWRAIAEWCGTQDVVNAYGLTETANWVAGASARDYSPTDGLVGRVWGGSAAVVDESGRLRASGEGEVVVQTPAVMRGYFQRPDLDDETWIGGWLRTRDAGRVDADGTIQILGRRGQEINRGGSKVRPDEIEQLLEQHRDVVEACAFGLPDEILGEAVGAAVVLAGGGDGTLDEVKSWAASRRSRYGLPDRWFVVDAIPRTDRGKVNRSAVAAFCLSLEPAAGRS